MHYRTQMKIIADLLSVAKDYTYEGEGVGITTLLRKGNLSYSRLVRILRDLVASGLILEVPRSNGNRYAISERGREFLTAYKRFAEFAKSYGLRL